MVRPSRRGRTLPLAESQWTDGVDVGGEDGIDWETGGLDDVVAQDQWKQPVVAATTGDVTIATALNAGDTVDGVTLAAGDRVLVRAQSNDEENGIYLVGTTPERAADMDEADEVLGALVYVIDGTANGGTVYRCDLTAAPVIDTDPITFTVLGSAVAELDDVGDVNAPTPSDGDVLTWDSTPGEWVAATPSGGGGVTVQDEGSPLTTTATTLDFVGAGVTATGSGATKTITIPGGGGGGSSIPTQSIPYPTSASGDDDLSASTAGWSDVGANAYSTFSSDGNSISLITGGASKTSTIRKTLGTTKAAAFDFRFGLIPNVDWWGATNDTNLTVYLRTSGGSQIAAVQFQTQQTSLPTPRSVGIAAAGSGAFTLSPSAAILIGEPVTLRITRDGSNVILFYFAHGGTPFDLIPLVQPGAGTYRAPITFTVSGTVARIEITTVTPAGPTTAAHHQSGCKLDYFVSA